MDGRVLKSCSCNHKIMENWRVSPCYYLKQLLHFICAQFLSSRMHWAVQVIIMFWIILFLKDFFKAASGAPSLENIRSTFFKATSEWMQKSIATFWPSSPHKECVVQSSFEIVFLLKHFLPQCSLASGKTIAMRERLPCEWPVSRLPGPSVSPPSLFSESSLSNVLQTDVECRSDVTK